MDNTILIAIISSSAFTTLLNFILNRVDKKSNINKALMCLLGYEIKGECRRLIKSKQATLDDLEQLEELNKIYRDFGGNGYVKNLMEKVGRLEVTHD